VNLGTSSRGTPLLVNRALMECDLKIGVGCIFPHPAAGFSGGSKIIMPAACGAETIRCMHDYLRGAKQRGDSLDTEMRSEMEEVATKVGLNFVVNAVLNQRRQIAGLFVGNRNKAHRVGVQFAIEHFSVNPVPDADIVVADMYPFDLDLQFAYDRGFWPLLDAKKHVDRVVIAACTRGMGMHEFFPIAKPLWSRLSRRLQHFTLQDLSDPITKLKTIKSVLAQKRMPMMMLSQGIQAEELREVLPRARLYNEWDEIVRELEHRHRGHAVRVAVYRSAPLLLPVCD
ncbi:MAG: lactate racemase domain-containing protein, partial [Bacteroidota bacterium]